MSFRCKNRQSVDVLLARPLRAAARDDDCVITSWHISGQGNDYTLEVTVATDIPDPLWVADAAAMHYLLEIPSTYGDFDRCSYLI